MVGTCVEVLGSSALIAVGRVAGSRKSSGIGLSVVAGSGLTETSSVNILCSVSGLRHGSVGSRVVVGAKLSP